MIATIRARCDACAWEVAGREGVTLELTLDGRYVAHVPLVRSGRADYPVLVGAVVAGRHVLHAEVDAELTATGLRGVSAATVERIDVHSAGRNADHLPMALAPILYARPNTIGRFTDVPVFMYYEREPTDRGTRFRYTVIFTNEDGGTPADRLMATWGRTTDIEYVYSVEVDAEGTILIADFQGPEHKVLPFAGPREGRHPLLWVVTDNNMVRDRGTTRVRYAPAPIPFALDGRSREAIMDANPWLYDVAVRELAREGKIVDNAPPGRGAIPDPRRFLHVEACGVLGDAVLAFEIAWTGGVARSDRGVPEYKIARDGCFRGAVPLPPGAAVADLRALRFSAYEGPRAQSRPTASVRIDRVNTVFVMDEAYRPGAPLLQWTGPATIAADGPPLEIPFARP